MGTRKVGKKKSLSSLSFRTKREEERKQEEIYLVEIKGKKIPQKSTNQKDTTKPKIPNKQQKPKPRKKSTGQQLQSHHCYFQIIVKLVLAQSSVTMSHKKDLCLPLITTSNTNHSYM